MEIKIEPASPNDFEQIFTVVKQGLFDHVDSVFGWDDVFQRDRLKTDYQSDWFHWVYVDDSRAGFLCFKRYDNALHVHLLVIEPQYQGKRIGAKVMNIVHQEAIAEMRQRVTLSSFTRNHRAIAFYRSLGYELVNTEENFVSLAWELIPSQGEKYTSSLKGNAHGAL